ncbi:MAG TPA: hypothetical protein VJR24_03710 [Gemmatimonadaceae bacterium]|nr:hypothetical protein [Gemmatimonadaceae bacterium]
MMLSKRQFASAAGATEKWVDNARRILSRRCVRTETEARWLRLVRTVSQAFDISLQRAGELATAALQLDPRSPPTTIGASGDGALGLVIDMPRYHARFDLALAAALLDGRLCKGPRRWQRSLAGRTLSGTLLGAAASGAKVSRLRVLATKSAATRVALLGEPVMAMLRDLAAACIPHVVVGDVAAAARGAVRDRPQLEACYAPEVAVIGRLATLLGHWNARPLNVSDKFPFVIDTQIIADSPVLALATCHGEIVLRQAADYSALCDSADLLDLGPVQTLVLRVEPLLAALRSTRRPVPVSAIPELEAAAALANWVNYDRELRARNPRGLVRPPPDPSRPGRDPH